MKNKKGLTLIESMIAVGISATVAVGRTTYLLNDAKDTKIDTVSSKIVKIVSAVDQRVYIDKYDISLWPAVTSYVTTNQMNLSYLKEGVSSL